jgi:hypothetical protein
MWNKKLKKGLLLTTGILSVVVIVLTQSFYKPTAEEKATAKTEQGDSTKQTTIHAPADVVANGNATGLPENIPFVPQQTTTPEDSKRVSAILKQGLINFFKTLFRTSIAPNAP